MFIAIVVVHIFACLVLIAVILLQAGRGGGLSEAFGGTSTDTILGTKTATFMTRLTSVCAIMYLVTCISLAAISSQRRTSLVSGVRTIAEEPKEAATAPVEKAENPDEGTVEEETETIPEVSDEPVPGENAVSEEEPIPQDVPSEVVSDTPDEIPAQKQIQQN